MLRGTEAARPAVKVERHGRDTIAQSREGVILPGKERGAVGHDKPFNQQTRFNFMQCPKRNSEMLDGNVQLRTSHLTRVVFTRDSYAENFAEQFLPGSIFDNQLRPGEVNVLRAATRGGKTVVPASRCPACGTIVIEE